MRSWWHIFSFSLACEGGKKSLAHPIIQEIQLLLKKKDPRHLQQPKYPNSNIFRVGMKMQLWVICSIILDISHRWYILYRWSSLWRSTVSVKSIRVTGHLGPGGGAWILRFQKGGRNNQQPNSLSSNRSGRNNSLFPYQPKLYFFFGCGTFHS